MARNGIYIGNKEIVRRYVGDKLVWRKSYYTKVFSGIYTVETLDKYGLKIEARVHGANWASYTGIIEEGKIELDDNLVFFSKLEADVYTDSYNYKTYNRLIITFLNQTDKNKIPFKFRPNADIKIFKKVYK